MYIKNILFLILSLITTAAAQTVPNLPIPTTSGTAETINDSIYFFGGSNRWAGTILYPSVYKYDGNGWSYYDSIPDDNVWGVESAIVGTNVFLFAGWPSGARLVRKYDVLGKNWTYLGLSPNTLQFGITVAHTNNHIYLFDRAGNVREYDFVNDTWLLKSPNTSAFSLSSVVYQDEIYVIGYYDSTFSKPFYKYNPVTDSWTQLASIPYQVSKCAMEVINDKIYCAGGSIQGSPSQQYNTLLEYDILSDTWSIDQFELSGNRVWMADVTYNNKFFVLGGLDTTSFAVDIVEEIIPQGPIPVELTSFTALVINKNVVLNWITATEVNNQGFEIERSADGISFNNIGFVPGFGTTTEPKSYNYTDQSVNSGTFYYRLKQIDYDGSFTYSDVAEIEVSLPTEFSLKQNYPNPFNPSTSIQFSLPVDAHVTINIYNLVGENVAEVASGNFAAGSHKVDFNANTLTSGIYFYQLDAAGIDGKTFSSVKKMTLLK